MNAIKKFLLAITYPVRRLYYLVHDSQADVEAVYPDSKPTPEQIAAQGAVNSGFMGGGVNH